MDSPVDKYISANNDREALSREYIKAISHASVPTVFLLMLGPIVMIALILIFINNTPVLLLILGIYLLLTVSLIFWRFRIDLEFKGLQIGFPAYLRYSSFPFSLLKFFFLVVLIPVFGVIQSSFPLTWYVESGFAVVVGAIVILIVTWNPSVHRMLKSGRELASDVLMSRIQTVTGENGMAELRPLIVDGNKLKVANAFAIGMLHPRVCITDYLYENLDSDETFALLCHELGHVRNRDMLKRGLTAITLVAVIGTFAILAILNGAGIVQLGINSVAVLGVLPIIFVVALFSFVFVYPFLMKRQETRADRFALKYSTYDSIVLGLLKTRFLNLIPLKFKGRTHPSIAIRMKRLMEFEQQHYR